MQPHRKVTVAELIERHKAECAHFTNGKCQTAGCMRWEGMTIVRPLEFVGCVTFQTIEALSSDHRGKTP